MGCFNSKVQAESVIKSTVIIHKFDSKSSTKDKSSEELNQVQKKFSEKVPDTLEELYINYRLIEEIKSPSSFSFFYKVLHIKTNELRCMRVIRKESIMINEDDFKKEINTLFELDHPNILKFYDFYSDSKYFYIICELINYNKTLLEQISDFEGINEKVISFIMEQIFSSILCLYNKGLNHRNITPEYIIINEQNYQIKIIDIGLFHLKNKLTKLTNHSLFPIYSAPELYQSTDNSSIKSDIWSCGIILFILLTGKLPITGKSSTELIDNLKKGKFCFDKKIWEPISKEAKYLVERLIRYNLNKRISIEEAWKDLWIIKNKKPNSSPKINSFIDYTNLKEFNFDRRLQSQIINYFVKKASNKERRCELQFLLNRSKHNSLNELKDTLSSFFNNHFILDYEIKKLEGKNIIEKDGSFNTNSLLNIYFHEDSFDNFFPEIKVSETINTKRIKILLDLVDPTTNEQYSYFKLTQRELDKYGDFISLDTLNQILFKVSEYI